MSKDSLLPDVHAMRKARVNSDLIKILSRPAPSYLLPITRGIGLYTHVAGPKNVPKNPHLSYANKATGEVALLPLGGPMKTVPNKFRKPPNEEIAALFEELKDAIKAEEEIWTEMRAKADAKGESGNDADSMSLYILKKKYGDADVPGPQSAKPQLDHPQQKSQKHSEIDGDERDESDETLKRRKTSSTGQASSSQRQSMDFSIEGTDTSVERRENASETGNIYEAYRDPRRRGR